MLFQCKTARPSAAQYRLIALHSDLIDHPGRKSYNCRASWVGGGGGGGCGSVGAQHGRRRHTGGRSKCANQYKPTLPAHLHLRALRQSANRVCSSDNNKSSLYFCLRVCCAHSAKGPMSAGWAEQSRAASQPAS